MLDTNRTTKPTECKKPHHITHLKNCDRCSGRGWFAIRGSDGDSFDCPACDGRGNYECDENECQDDCADIACTCDAEVAQ